MDLSNICLFEKERELYKECQKYSDKITTIKIEIEKIRSKIQNNCKHEWVHVVQPYQKEVYCNKCNLFDWEKTKYY